MEHPVTAEIKTILMHNVRPADNNSLDRYDPTDPTNFGCGVQILIGPVGEAFSDSFDILVCSPSWFANRIADGDWATLRRGVPYSFTPDVAPGAPFWFMRAWNKDQFRSALDSILEAASPGPDWGTVASRIARMIPWEFDYRFDDFVNDSFGEHFPPETD